MTEQEQIEEIEKEYKEWAVDLLKVRFDLKPEAFDEHHKNNYSFENCADCLWNKIKGSIEELLLLRENQLPENAVVITREEYDELVNLQQTHSEELTNAIQSYEEDKADLEINYCNHIKNLDKIIDRQNKDLNSQANRLIGLKAKLENSRKKTAKEIMLLLGKGYDETKRTDFKDLEWYKAFCRELNIRYGIEVEE